MSDIDQSGPSDVPTGLLFVEAGDVPQTANMLLYGPTGSGKSTAGATLPGPIILWVNAEGADALVYPRMVARRRGVEIREVRIGHKDRNAREVLREVIKYARTMPEGSSVVLDTVAKIRDALIRQLVRKGASNTLQMFGDVADVLYGTVLELRDLPINLLLVCHQDEDQIGDERVVQPLIGGALTEKIPTEMTFVGYTSAALDEETRQVKYWAQLVEAKGRLGCKNRGGALGAYRELDLSEWLATYRAAIESGTLTGEDDLPWKGEGEPDYEDAYGNRDPVDPSDAVPVPRNDGPGEYRRLTDDELAEAGYDGPPAREGEVPENHPAHPVNRRDDDDPFAGDPQPEADRPTTTRRRSRARSTPQEDD